MATAKRRYYDIARSSTGGILGSPLVYVYAAGTTTTSTIYSDGAGTAKSNPFVGGADGLFEFYVDAGDYKIRVEKTGYEAFEVDNVEIGYDFTELGGLTARSISTTSPLTGGGDLSANRTLGFDAFLDVREHGAVGDGTTDDTAAIATAFAALDENALLVFPANKTFRITATVAAQLPPRSVVMAYGAKFVAEHDGVCFDLNPGADFTNASTVAATVIRDCRWFGGSFDNTNGTKSASVALQAHIFRGLVIRDAYFEDFWTAIEFAGLDTYKFSDIRMFRCNYGIRHPHGLVQASNESLQTCEVQNVHFAFTSPSISGISIEDKVNALHVGECSFNGVTTGPAIRVDDGFSAVSRRINIVRNKFEQGTSSGYYIDLIDTESIGFIGVTIEDNEFASGAAGWKVARLARCSGVRILGNTLVDGSGGSTEEAWNLDANCVDIEFSANIYGNFNASTRFAGAVPRTEIRSLPEVRVIAASVLTGYNGSSHSTATETIDMSAALSSFPTGGLAPKGYWMTLEAKDSGSAAGFPIARLKKNVGSSDFVSLTNRLGGVPNDVGRAVQGYVEADANGDVFLSKTATGASTLDLWIGVTAIHM